MSFFSFIVGKLFPPLVKGKGTPGNVVPHDYRGDETVDMTTGIGMVDGQELDNTSIDPDIQDKEKGFPKC
jgi:hypothetical protein